MVAGGHQEAEGVEGGQQQKHGGCGDPGDGEAPGSGFCGDRQWFGRRGGVAVAEAIAHICPGRIGVGDGDG
jgi:hypothetical protein